jgi:uncharacterized YigZ family protein
MAQDSYRIPAGFSRTEMVVTNSRFITSVSFVETVDKAKAFLAQIRAEMPDASHHVYAFRVGYRNSVIEGMSDDGEPSGTAGPPTLAVLRGADIGDIVLITTRYFSGTKLGTGGLVRAYTDAAQHALEELEIEEKVEKQLLGFDIPYNFHKLTRQLIESHHGIIRDEMFATSVTLFVELPKTVIPAFVENLQNLTSGQIQVVEFDK